MSKSIRRVTLIVPAEVEECDVGRTWDMKTWKTTMRVHIRLEDHEGYSCDPVIEKYGDLSWELDALTPEVLVRITNEAVLRYRNEELWAEARVEEKGRKTLNVISEEFLTVVDFLRSMRAAKNSPEVEF